MIKIVLFDVDGVIIKKRKAVLSDRLFTDYDIEKEKVVPLFVGESSDFNESVIGRKSLSECLIPYLKIWGWKGDLQEFLEYWLSGEAEKDQELVDEIPKLRAKGIKCYLILDQVKERADYLLNKVALKDVFDGFFFSYETGMRKYQPEYFPYILNMLGMVNPKEVIFWDDEEEDLSAASGAKIKIKKYIDIKDFTNNMRKIAGNF